jgi:hypothetical protein
MSNIGEVLAFVLMTCFVFGLLALMIKACADDARRRGKSPVWVVLAAVFFFPWGLIAWLLFRPEPIDSDGDGRAGDRRFRLENHRVQ